MEKTIYTSDGLAYTLIHQNGASHDAGESKWQRNTHAVVRFLVVRRQVAPVATSFFPVQIRLFGHPTSARCSNKTSAAGACNMIVQRAVALRFAHLAIGKNWQ